MKIHYVMLVVVVALAVYVGINMNNENTITVQDISVKNQTTNVESVVNTVEKTEFTEEHKKSEFKKFYQNMYRFIHNFEQISESTTNMAAQNPSRNEQYDFFTKAKKVMEEGQGLPLTRLIPVGFNKKQTKMMKESTTELYYAYQYRKFGYEHYLEYLETASPKTYNTSVEWLKSSNSSVNSVIINLEALRVELGYEGIEPE